MHSLTPQEARLLNLLAAHPGWEHDYQIEWEYSPARGGVWLKMQYAGSLSTTYCQFPRVGG